MAIAALALANCHSAAYASADSEAAPQSDGATVKAGCENKSVRIDTEFDTGNIASCRFRTANRVVIEILPEDAPPINCSAWYAFRVTPAVAGPVKINLSYRHCGHRYRPKISRDGKNWQDLPEGAVRISEEDGVRQASFTVPLDRRPLFVAAQEIIAPADNEAWIAGLAQSPAVHSWVLGQSAQGRPITAMTIKAPGTYPAEQVVLTGRQHPPEVTGAMAMQSFVEAILGDDALAVQFRQRFEVIVIPMLNPDGVAHGHWRHNAGSTDLNRDWGPFKQPETRLMQSLLAEIDGDLTKKLRLFVDFHSTNRDVFYTLPDEQGTDPPLFTRDWLSRLQMRMPGYEVTYDAGHNANLPTSKSYVYEKYGVPTATFEIGDQTNRPLIGRLGTEAALAMMETLLKTPPIDPNRAPRDQ